MPKADIFLNQLKRLFLVGTEGAAIAVELFRICNMTILLHIPVVEAMIYQTFNYCVEAAIGVSQIAVHAKSIIELLEQTVAAKVMDIAQPPVVVQLSAQEQLKKGQDVKTKQKT